MEFKDHDNIQLKGELLGQVISENLSNLLRKYITKDDKATISAATKVGMHTLAKLIVRDNTLTRRNAVAVVEMVKTAIMRCDQVIEDAKIARIELKAILVEDNNTKEK